MDLSASAQFVLDCTRLAGISDRTQKTPLLHEGIPHFPLKKFKKMEHFRSMF